MITFGSVKSRRVALITGASSGFGQEFAKIFASDGIDVVLVARRTSLLKKLASEIRSEYNVNAYVYSYDLSKNDSPKKLFKALQKKQLRIFYLINNAGFGDYGLFDTLQADRVSEMIMVNIKALTELCHLYLPIMKKRKCGYILNLASMASFMPGPYMAEYFATKSYVLSFSEALHKEYQEHNVFVSALCPGPSDTAFFKDNSISNSSVFKGELTPAKQIALVGYNNMLNNKPIIIDGNKNKILAYVARVLPKKYVLNKAYKLMNSTTKKK